MNKTVIPTKCPICGNRKIIEVRTSDYLKYESKGMNIQNCFPYLSIEDRERLKTGICGKCWYALFSA